MNELDEVWARMLEKSLADAHDAGRADVAEYLALKAANDLVRTVSVKWLFDSLLEIAAQNNPRNLVFTLDEENPHRFDFNKAKMVGSLVRLRLGVRCLTLEAGWTRTPSDGFMRRSALAVARISHFGIAKANEDLILLRPNAETAPQWFSIDKSERQTVFDSHNLHRHFKIFTEE